MQGVFPGKFHRRKPLIPVMNRFGSLGVPDECVIAPPASMFQFMHLHLDFNAFVAALNHGALLSFMGVSRIQLCRVCSKLLTSGCCGGTLSNLLTERCHRVQKWFGFDPLLQLFEIG
jgi:hypothetical protein